VRDRLWYRDAVIYQLHVRAFADSNGDGIGDFRGLAQKLDYLQDLGVTTLWLLPFYPSPLRDDGYDIADYTDVHPAYGTLRDFRAFLREAHQRDLKVVTELVLNHTSDQHPWFQRARQAGPGSKYRDWYVWSDTADRYRGARIIFKDFEQSNWAWDSVAQAYYWHRFYAHQPDLNFENPAVHRAVLKALDFWLDMGVDGLRLDAVPYLYEREGTNCENLPETHEFLKKLRRHVDRKYGDRMLLAEANQWPDDAVAYFGDGDECHMAFHFPVMPRLFMGVHTEDRFPVVDILQQTPPIPEGAQWAVFLRNHDELTLEMVTDEDRDYMYRVYAQDPRARINLGIRRRLAPLMGNSRRKIELMNSLLFSLPGTPIIYYGDEIGMGDNIYLGDRNGVRTPMQWSGDRNAGFSRSNPQRLFLPVITDPEYHFEAINVEAQQRNPQSFLWWMKRLIAQRKRYPVLGTGTIEFLQPENRKVLAFLRESDDERLLVVANLSRFVQCAELDLAHLKGTAPVEVFGQTRFPVITEDPYLLTLAPHTFYWFALERRAAEPEAAPAGARLGAVTVADSWEQAFDGPPAEKLERALMRWLPQRRWFGAKARDILNVRVLEAIRVAATGEPVYLTMLLVSYTDGDPDTYFVPLAFAADAAADERIESGLAVARIRRGHGDDAGVLYDAVGSEAFGRWMLEILPSRRQIRGRDGAVGTTALKTLRDAVKDGGSGTLDPEPLGVEQSNSSVAYGDRFMLKLFRRLDEGVSPELEMGRFLTTRTSFRHVPAVVGAMEYRRADREPLTVGVMQAFVPNEGDAWRYTVDAVDHFFEHVLTANGDVGVPAELPDTLVADEAVEVPSGIGDLIGMYLGSARLLGQRTAELHVALGSRTDEPAFAPEPFTALYQRSLYQSLRTKAEHSLNLLHKRSRSLPPDVHEGADAVLAGRDVLLTRLRAVSQRQLGGMRIRCHGDYHLGQVLYTGRDFVILDFEGEPALSLGQRRLKRSPLVDVAGMLRSFAYAASSALIDGRVRPEDVETLAPWADLWQAWVSRVFLDAYGQTATPSGLLPRSVDDVRLLLDCYQIEKALYELAYELNNRPTWTRIPLRGIQTLLRHGGDAA
jgi:maltose alpha-D-glucosyltransferase / alpha-amylase